MLDLRIIDVPNMQQCTPQTVQSGGQSIDSYRGFALSRPALSQILQLAIESSSTNANHTKNLSYDSIRQGTTLGTNFVESMRRYIRHTRLLDNLDHPTDFGKLVHSIDGGLSKPSTQWALHYHLSSARNGSLVFWHDVLLNKMRPGNIFAMGNAAEYIAEAESHYGRTYAARTLKNAASAFVGSYCNVDALNTFGLFKKTDDKYAVQEPAPPSVHVFAYSLAEHWAALWQDRSTINLREITDENGPANALFLNSGETDYYLAEMQESGLLEVNRRVPPYQVVRLWDSMEQLLERLYG